MSNLPIIEAAKDELTAIFKDLHQNPEIGFTEPVSYTHLTLPTTPYV